MHIAAPETAVSPSSFNELGRVFVAHRQQLKRAAQDILGSAENAEDLVQDACLKALESPPDATLQQPLAYAFRTVRNLAIDRYRRAAFESRVFEVEEEGLRVAAPGPTPEAAVMERQQLSQLMRALAQLPARARKALELYRLEGVTQREIAVMFGISTTMVNLLIRDAVAHCRAAVRGDGSTSERA
jgi:RNA polymerase sigma-70 factor (ECF subfamily)